MVGLLGEPSLADQGHLVGQGQHGPLPLIEQRGFAPGGQRQQALGALPMLHRHLGVHLDAVGAAVEHGGPQLDELLERQGNVGAAEIGFQPPHGLDGGGDLAGELDTTGHGKTPWMSAPMGDEHIVHAFIHG
ncbi:hypothetical protein D3C78_1028880 [compost metagenome]